MDVVACETNEAADSSGMTRIFAITKQIKIRAQQTAQLRMLLHEADKQTSTRNGVPCRTRWHG